MLKPKPRKLLTAAVGVATVSYVVACGGLSDASNERRNGGGWETSGNLMAPPDGQPWGEDLVGPPFPGSGGWATSGNLMAPPTYEPPASAQDAGAAPPAASTTPDDAGLEADASDLPGNGQDARLDGGGREPSNEGFSGPGDEGGDAGDAGDEPFVAATNG